MITSSISSQELKPFVEGQYQNGVASVSLATIREQTASAVAIERINLRSVADDSTESPEPMDLTPEAKTAAPTLTVMGVNKERPEEKQRLLGRTVIQSNPEDTPKESKSCLSVVLSCFGF